MLGGNAKNRTESEKPAKAGFFVEWHIFRGKKCMTLMKPKKVFIVDAGLSEGLALRDYLLKDTPHHVECFRTGEECLQHMEENPDAVVLDYYLDKAHGDAEEGLQVIESIKENYPNVHIIMLSSQDRYAMAAQTIQKGVEDYVIDDADAFENIAGIINAL